MVGRHRAIGWIAAAVLGVALFFCPLAALGQLPPEREPDVVLLRDGKRVECVVVSISNEVLYYNVVGRDGLQQVGLHKVMTIALGAPRVDVLAQAKMQADEKRQAEAIRQAEEAERKAKEEARLAEERRQAEKAAEEERIAEEVRRAAAKREAQKAEAEQKAKEEAEQKEVVAAQETGKGNAVVPAQIASSESWKDVVVTKDEADVKGMLFVDKYDLTLTQSSNWSRAKSDEMELGATIQLQKRAVQRRATHLLIKEVEFKRTYGEPPSIHIVGEAYRKRN